LNYDGPNDSGRLKLNQQKSGDIANTPAGDNGDDDISIHSSGEADHSEEYRDIDAKPRNSKGNSNSESLSFTGPPFAGIVQVKIPFPNVIVIYIITIFKLNLCLIYHHA